MLVIFSNFDTPYFMYDQYSDKIKKPGQIVNKLKQNCEYLSNVKHIKEVKNAHKRVEPKDYEVCPESFAKAIVQMTYLLYASSILQVDMYMSSKCIFLRKNPSSNYEVQLLFYLALQSAQIVNDQQLNKQCDFTLVRSYKFSYSIIEILQKLFKQTNDLLADNSPTLNLAKLLITNFQKCIKKHIQPQLLNDPEFAVIKQLQKTKLFAKYSDLFHIYKSSILYMIKKKSQVLDVLANMKHNVLSMIPDHILKNNSHAFYRTLDQFLNYLTTKQIIYLQKSSTNLRNHHNYIVGSLMPYDRQQKSSLKYRAQFYTLNISQNQSSKTIDQQKQRETQKNMYILEYSAQKLTMQVAYISILEATNQNLDIICTHISNILFYDTKLIIDTVQIPCQTQSTNAMKRYILFKASIRILQIQEPLTKFLILVQYCTICAKIFLQLMMKKIQKHQHEIVRLYMARLDHLVSIFVQKAKLLYQGL